MKRRPSMETLDNRRLLTSLMGSDAVETGLDDSQSFRTWEPPVAEVSSLETADSGEVIPKLEIERTANYGGSRATYLKYELTNVQVTAFDVNASGNNGNSPGVADIDHLELAGALRPAWQAVKENAIQDLEAVKDGIRDFYLDDAEQFADATVDAADATATNHDTKYGPVITVKPKG